MDEPNPFPEGHIYWLIVGFKNKTKLASFYFVQAESEQRREIGINGSYWKIGGCGGANLCWAFDISKRSIMLQWRLTSARLLTPLCSCEVMPQSGKTTSLLHSPLLFWLFRNMSLLLRWSQDESGMLIFQCVFFQTSRFFGSLIQWRP